MYNYVMVMGRLERVEKIDAEHAVFVLECNSTYQDDSGKHLKNSIPVHIITSILRKVEEKSIIGQQILIKGRVELNNEELNIVAERIMLLEQRESE